MSISKGVCWQCEGCGAIENIKPWKCPMCGKEICEHCFDRYALCRECAAGKTDDECKKAAQWVEQEF
jgi:hypothetical protein